MHISIVPVGQCRPLPALVPPLYRLVTTASEGHVELLLLPSAVQSTTEVLPGLGLLPHTVTVLPFDAAALVERSGGDLVLLDARRDLAAARSFTRVLTAIDLNMPVVAILTEGGLVALSADWAIDDILLDTAGPAELEARLRLALARPAKQAAPAPG